MLAEAPCCKLIAKSLLFFPLFYDARILVWYIFLIALHYFTHTP